MKTFVVSILMAVLMLTGCATAGGRPVMAGDDCLSEAVWWALLVPYALTGATEPMPRVCP